MKDITIYTKLYTGNKNRKMNPKYYTFCGYSDREQRQKSSHIDTGQMFHNNEVMGRRKLY